jgi:DNA repair protein RecO (recombination protein O)
LNIETPAIVCGLRMHAEHGAVVRLMTPDDGLQAAYVRGARGRRMRPVLVPGNLVQARLRSRTEEQLAHAEIELIHSRAPLLSEPLPAAAIDWATALTAATLPEGQHYPRVYDGLDALLGLIEAAPSALGWASQLVRYELLLLAELGFGLDLDRCAVSGTNDNLVAVSPRSGRAVSAAEAEPHAGKLLTLPRFVREGGSASWDEIRVGLELSGHFLSRDVLAGRPAGLAEARSRLTERLFRAGGLI